MIDDAYRERAQQQRRDDGSTERLAREFALAAERVEAEEGESSSEPGARSRE